VHPLDCDEGENGATGRQYRGIVTEALELGLYQFWEPQFRRYRRRCEKEGLTGLSDEWNPASPGRAADGG
jgi:hypothetical protein